MKWSLSYVGKQIALPAGIALCFAIPALADDIIGAWVIKAEMSNGNGVMFILAKEGNTYTCEFTLGPSEQECKIFRNGDKIIVKSKVIKAPQRYWPDNFNLTLVNENRMEGKLLSGDAVDVVLTRQ